jgi:hypothetical protein
VGARLPRLRVAQTTHNKGANAHAPRYNSIFPKFSRSGPLSCDPKLFFLKICGVFGVINFAGFTRTIIVVDINRFRCVYCYTNNLINDSDHSIHHRLSIVICVRLTPLHIFEVGLTLRRINSYIVQVIGLSFFDNPLLFHLSHSNLVIVLCGVISDSSAARVEHKPHLFGFIFDNFKKVVASAKSAQLTSCLFVNCIFEILCW